LAVPSGAVPFAESLRYRNDNDVVAVFRSLPQFCLLFGPKKVSNKDASHDHNDHAGDSIGQTKNLPDSTYDRCCDQCESGDTEFL
jgi:hypothetical protein